MSVYEMSASELFQQYAANMDPQEILDVERDEVARRLMNEHGLEEKAAFYAADQIFEYVHSRTGS